MKTKTLKKSIKLSALASIMLTIFHPALAQEAQVNDKDSADKMLIEKIEVTARKRSESIQDIPVAVTAVTSDDIEKRGIIGVEDLSDSTPGLVVTNNYTGKTDRSVQTLTLRGFTPSSGVEATVAMFIDGVPVSSTTAMSSVGSPDRIEILRGPQSAYFGRNTFAGAVNVVNKMPNDEWAGSIKASLGSDNYTRLQGSAEGVLIEDKLSFRASAETYSKDGAWQNESPDGGRLGDQKTSMANLYVVAKPVEDLTIKAFGFMSKDEDGPAASAFVSAYDLFDSAGNLLVKGQSNCDVNGSPYFCSVPTKDGSLQYNSNASDAVKNLLNNPTNRVTSTGLLDNYGLGREYYHGHLVADWELGDSGYTISSLSGYNKEEWVILNDIDHYYSNTFNYGFLVDHNKKDVSQELRLSYDNNGAFSGTLGISYLDAEDTGTLTSVLTTPWDGEAVPEAVSPTGKTTTTTKGIFFGTSYDFTESTNLSIEGRLQSDEITSDNIDGSLLATKKYTNFLPRIILNHDLGKDTMIFGSYSKGVNPASFNTGLLTVSDFVREAANNAGIKLTADPEEVANYELGIKGSALGGSMNYAIAAYYANWTKQINRINIVVVEPGEDTATSFSGVANTGKVALHGLEFETTWMATENIRVNAAAAYTGSDIKNHTNYALTQLSGVSDFSGKEQPGISKYSGNLGIQYTNNIGDYDYFTRVDYVYKTGQWSNQANFLKSDNIQKVNLRAGITIGDLDIQAYVNNVFENDSYGSVSDYYAFDYTYQYFGANSGLVMSLPEQRTFGVELKWSFYE